MNKPELPIPITLACSILTGNQVNLRYSQLEERDVVIDAYFIAAIWRVLGGEIRERRSRKERQLALMNAVYVGAGDPLESALDVRKVAAKDKRVSLAKETLLGVACTFRARGYTLRVCQLPTPCYALPAHCYKS